ncbi:hypothetical protein BKH27_00235 [Actinomyces oris]|uniref:Uncharacterized protein n=1 Tax=Actinomyces oris TaxID=544580 RepID=A0A1Q8W334_9ACTO|nr:hypothetical protein BKH27_00235 [Actinomyces oris]
MLIDFSSGPIHCRSCGAVMRPSKGITNGWPASTVPYGRAGECRSCVTPATAEARHADEAETATAVEQPLSPTKAAPTPNAVPRRRPRHRFDYRPPTENLCFSCGRPINPLTGECRCSD